MPKRDPMCPVCHKPNPGGGDCPWCAVREGRVTERKEKLRKKAARTGKTTSTAMFRCMNGHTWRADVNPKLGIDSALFKCPTCDSESMVEGILRAERTNATCKSNCWFAEDLFNCRCSCGGVNHGQGGPPIEDDEPVGA